MTANLGPTRSTELGQRTWIGVDAAPKRLLLVPLGATEQHGPHLPVATDTLLATAWANGVAEVIEGAVVAPALAYGSSGEHQDFAGTLSIGGPVLRAVIIELTRSAAQTFDHVAFLSGHAGNLRDLHQATAQLRQEGHGVTGLVPTWPDGQRWSIDAHAGRTETSLMLHLCPDLVRTGAIEAGNTLPLEGLMARLSTDGVAAVSANGVLGDPREAAAEEGRQLLDDLVTRTVDHLSRSLGDPAEVPRS